MQPLYATLLSCPKQYATALGNRLWKWYATALCNPLSYPKQYVTALGNRLWKWYATALCNPIKLPKTICNRFRQPLMEMVCNRFMQPR
jgi:hypothetical protein